MFGVNSAFWSGAPQSMKMGTTRSPSIVYSDRLLASEVAPYLPAAGPLKVATDSAWRMLR